MGCWGDGGYFDKWRTFGTAVYIWVSENQRSKDRTGAARRMLGAWEGVQYVRKPTCQ